MDLIEIPASIFISKWPPIGNVEKNLKVKHNYSRCGGSMKFCALVYFQMLFYIESRYQVSDRNCGRHHYFKMATNEEYRKYLKCQNELFRIW